MRGNILRKLHLMGDDDHCRPLFGKLLHHLQHLADELRVKRRGRLIKEDDVGLCRDGTRNADALLLPARELRGVVVGAVFHADLAQRLHRGLMRL